MDDVSEVEDKFGHSENVRMFCSALKLILEYDQATYLKHSGKKQVHTKILLYMIR